LQQAREHERTSGLAQPETADLFLEVEVGEAFVYEHEHLLTGMSFAMAKCARADRSLHDRDVMAALHNMARTYETLVKSGLHYESPMASAAQHQVATEVQEMVKQFREAELKQLGYSRLRDSEVLRALVFLVRLAHSKTSGRPRSRAFVDFLFSQFPEKDSLITTPAESPSRIIVP
jgi:hypothetical protein